MPWCLIFLLSRPATAEDPQTERIAAASEAYTLATAALTVGVGDAEAVYRWSWRWMVSVTAADPAGTAAALAAHRARMTDLHGTLSGQVAQGLAPSAALAAARYYLAEAEVLVGRGLPVE